MLNNKQSRDISRLSIKGQRDSILAGYAISSKIPYGYQRGWVEGKKGENANTRLHPIYEPHPVHADHVRMMFKMRAKGSSTGEIGEHLMMLGIPSPSGKKRWPKGTIVKTLRNRAHLGELEYFKTSKSLFPKQRRARKQIRFVGAHEALVSEKLFNKVQKKIKDDTKPGTNSPRSKTSPNPLSELIKCVNCSDGSDEPHPNMVMMNGRHEKELTCSAKKNSGVKYCQTPNIPMEPFLNLIVSALLDSALTEHVMQEQIQIIIDNNQQLVAEERERQAGIKKRISDIKTQEDNLLMSLRDREASHPIATDLLMNDLEKLGQDRIEYESQSRNLDDDVAETIAFATEPETIIKAALDLRTYLEATDKSAAKTFLHGLIKRVDVAHDTATIHYGLPMPNAQETEHGYTTTVSLDDLEDGPKLLLEHGSPLRTWQHHPHFQQGLRRVR